MMFGQIWQQESWWGCISYG